MADQGNGVNHASGLPAMDNKGLQIILGTRLSEIMITQYRRTLPVLMFLDVDMDVDLCGSITYLCEDQSADPQISDSALDAATVRRTLPPPSTVSFNGFCKGSFETKLSKEQLQCINQSQILRSWYFNSLSRSIEAGKESIMARFYRHIMVRGTHGKNTGLNAGLEGGGQVVGSRSNPVLLTPNTVDDWHMALINVVKQMPRNVESNSEFGASTDNMFLFGPAELESLYMKNDDYNSWNKVGDCANCALFKDTFDRMPRGIMPITSYCVESYTIGTGATACKAYPVLFGRRYMGTKAALRVETTSYDTEDRQSTIFRTDYYWHIHTYDCRTMGISWVSIEDTQPATITCS